MGGPCDKLFDEHYSDELASFLHIPKLPPEVAEKRNAALLTRLNNQINVPEKGISMNDAFEIFNQLGEHPTASLKQLNKYDPAGCFGFCFGRAVAVHLAAINRNIPNENIRKMWAVGNLKAFQTEWLKIWEVVVPTDMHVWDFHVTTIIRSKDGGWWAIDPVLIAPVKAEVWFEIMHNMNPDRDTQLIVSRPSRFSVFPERLEGVMSMPNWYYNGYFHDLVKSFPEAYQSIANMQ